MINPIGHINIRKNLDNKLGTGKPLYTKAISIVMTNKIPMKKYVLIYINLNLH